MPGATAPRSAARDPDVPAVRVRWSPPFPRAICRPARQRALAAGLTLAGLALSIFMAAHSPGGHQDDDLTHFQIAAWAWHDPAYLLSNWGRPGFTCLYALPARFGWTAARIFTGLLTALTCWLAWVIACRLGLRLAGLVPGLLWLQPLTFTLSYTTLTEPVLTFYVTLAVWCYIAGRFAASAALMSLAAITRYEVLPVLALWGAALAWRRTPPSTWLRLAWAPLVYSAAHLLVLGEPPWAGYVDQPSSGEYGRGTWLTMLGATAAAIGAGPMILGLLGADGVARRAGGGLWAACMLLYFLLHTVVFRFGLFDSGGYPRFMVPLGPFLAVAGTASLGRFRSLVRLASRASSRAGPRACARLAATCAMLTLGLAWTVEREAPPWLGWALTAARWGLGGLLVVAAASALLGYDSRRGSRATAATIVPLSLLGLAVYQCWIGRQLPPPHRQCAPLALNENARMVQDAVAWLERAGLSERRVAAPSPWVDHFLRRWRPFRTPPLRQQLESLRPGELCLWDPQHGPSPRRGIALSELSRRGDFVRIWCSEPAGSEGAVSIWQKVAVAPPGGKDTP